MSCIGSWFGSSFHFGIALFRFVPFREEVNAKRTPEVTPRTLLFEHHSSFFEHGDLALILRAALAAGGADYGQDGERF